MSMNEECDGQIVDKIKELLLNIQFNRSVAMFYYL